LKFCGWEKVQHFFNTFGAQQCNRLVISGSVDDMKKLAGVLTQEHAASE